MSTIIVPGGTSGMRLNIVNTVINVGVIYFAYKTVKAYYEKLEIDETVNIIDVFKLINVDLTGLFASTPSDGNPMYETSHAVDNAGPSSSPASEYGGSVRTMADAPHEDKEFKGMDLDA